MVGRTPPQAVRDSRTAGGPGDAHRGPFRGCVTRAHAPVMPRVPGASKPCFHYRAQRAHYEPPASHERTKPFALGALAEPRWPLLRHPVPAREGAFLCLTKGNESPRSEMVLLLQAAVSVVTL